MIREIQKADFEELEFDLSPIMGEGFFLVIEEEVSYIENESQNVKAIFNGTEFVHQDKAYEFKQGEKEEVINLLNQYGTKSASDNNPT